MSPEMLVRYSKSLSLARIKSMTHQFEFDYFESQQIPIDQHISSPPFSVGGHDWVLDFHPHGSDSDYTEKENDGSHVSLYLTLISETKEVQAEYSFKILDKTGKFVPFDEPILHTFTSRADDCSLWGYPEFISKDKIESCYCKDGKLVISCNVRVLSAPRGVNDYCGGLYEDIEKLWGKGERCDVTFDVEGERIFAHRFMLAVRSPVFEAELYGSMAEGNLSCIKINDMKAEVFKALLRFIYTDDFNYEHRELKVLSVESVQDLLVAANRYALPMLKAQCEQRLWVTLSMDTVLSTLILAERHSSPWLKEKCLEFASKSENFTQLVLTEEYVDVMQSLPSLLHELREKVNSISSGTLSHAAKKQKCAG